VRLGKRFGRVGFVVGFIGPLMFYLVPYPFKSRLGCPLCPYIEVPFAHPLLWLQIGLELGLVQGLIFAILGFAIGYLISKIKQSA
jgi:hypothetical protein